MSRTIARLMLSMLIIAASVVVYITTAMVVDRAFNLRDPYMFVAAGVATALFIGGAWVWVWKDVVKWTKSRRNVAAMAFLGGAFVAFFVSLGLREIGIDYGLEVMLGSLTGIVVWLGALILIWRETPAERKARTSGTTISCPNCGYNLTGLKQTTCPECGSVYSLEELLAAQKPGKEIDA